MPATWTLRPLTHSLSTRLFALLSLTIAACFGSYAMVQLRATSQHWEQRVNDGAQELSDVILSSTRWGMLHNRKEDVHRSIESIAGTRAVENVRIYDKQGVIIFSAAADEIGTKVDLRAEACVSCHTGPTPLGSVPVGERSRTFERSGGERVLGLITPIVNAPDCSTAACHAHPPGQSVLGVLDVTMSLSEADARLASLRRNAWIAALVLAVIAGLFSALFVLRVVRRPVRALIRGTSRVAAGDLDTEIRVPHASEMETLASSFNMMMRDLKRARAELRDWNQRLESNLQEKTAELGRTQRQISHMDKMASLGRLAATVAHELNNPLAGIQSYAKLVERSLRELPLPDDQRTELTRYVGAIQREAARSGDIVRNLLAFARQSGGQLSEQRLAPILERALLLVRHSLQMSQVQIEAPPIAGDDRLWCDGDQIQQALVALLVNAVEAMPQGGKLRVEVEPRPDSLALAISDTGCGIPPDVLPHIFEPFVSSKDRTEGVGLGLAVVYGIVQRHGGEIEVDSSPGSGTTFRIELPRRSPQGDGATTTQDPRAPLVGAGSDRRP